MTHQQLTEEWKEKLPQEFPQLYHGYLQGTFDKRIEEFVGRAMLAAAKGSAEAGRVQEFVPPIKLEPDFTTAAYNLARSQSERQLDEYFKGI